MPGLPLQCRSAAHVQEAAGIGMLVVHAASCLAQADRHYGHCSDASTNLSDRMAQAEWLGPLPLEIMA